MKNFFSKIVAMKMARVRIIQENSENLRTKDKL